MCFAVFQLHLLQFIRLTSCARGDTICPRPARCTHAAAHIQSIALTPASTSAPCAMNIHDGQAPARSGRWRRNWSRRHTLCSDLNSQPKRPGDLGLDLLTLKVVSESCVTSATSVPILVFLCLSVLELGPMYATYMHTYIQTNRQTDVRQKHRLMPRLFGERYKKFILLNGHCG